MCDIYYENENSNNTPTITSALDNNSNLGNIYGKKFLIFLETHREQIEEDNDNINEEDYYITQNNEESEVITNINQEAESAMDQDRINNRSIELLDGLISNALTESSLMDKEEENENDFGMEDRYEIQNTEEKENENENSFDEFVNKKKAELKDFIIARGINIEMEDENDNKKENRVNREKENRVNTEKENRDNREKDNRVNREKDNKVNTEKENRVNREKENRNNTEKKNRNNTEKENRNNHKEENRNNHKEENRNNTEKENVFKNKNASKKKKAFAKLIDSPLNTSDNLLNDPSFNFSDVVEKPNRLAYLKRLSLTNPNNPSSSNPSHTRNIKSLNNKERNSFLISEDNSNPNKDSSLSYPEKLIETYDTYSNSNNNFVNSSYISYLDLNSSGNIATQIANFKLNSGKIINEPKDGLFAKKIKSMFMYIHNSYKNSNSQKKRNNFNLSKIKLKNIDENEKNSENSPEKKFETPNTLEIINNFNDIRRKSKNNYNNLITGYLGGNNTNNTTNNKSQSRFSNNSNLNNSVLTTSNSSFNTAKSFKIDEINKIISKMAI
jgi:hypothetical protein